MGNMGITTAEQEQGRVKVLKEQVPKLFELSGRLLYVGGGPGKLQLVSYLTNYDITLLDIHEPNLQVEGMFNKVLGDVRDARAIFPHNHFDVTIWWHGPEHLYYRQIGWTLEGLRYATKKLIIIAAPYGYSSQGIYNDNIHERHLSHLLPEDFHDWGFDFAIIGAEGSGNESCLIGWTEL